MSVHKSSRRGFAKPALPGWMSKLIVLIVLIVIVMMLWGSIVALGKKLFGGDTNPKPKSVAVNYTEAGPGMNIVPGKNEVGLPVGGYTGCFTAPVGYHITEDHDRRYDVRVKGLCGKLLPALEIRGDCAKDGVGYVSTRFTGYKVKSFSARNRGRQPASVTVWLRPI